MTTYLDTSVVVSLLTEDSHTERARRIALHGGRLALSDLTATEFASALAIQYRNGRAGETELRTVFEMFDNWRSSIPENIEMLGADLRGAEATIRSLRHPLRTADAVHLMIARRIGASLATFDRAMARAAPDLGVGLYSD